MTTVVEHDWSAYNRYIEQTARAIGVDMHPPPAPIDWWARAKAIAIVTVAAGLAIALVLWAWPRPQADQRAVEQFPGMVAAPAPQYDVLPPTLLVPPEKPAGSTAVHAVETVRNYVIFTTRTLPGMGAVKTGWQFADNTARKPHAQWCYLEPDNLRRGGAAVTIELPHGGGPLISDATLSSYGLARDQVVRAQSLCAWFGSQP